MDRAALRRLRRFVAGLCLLGWPLAVTTAVIEGNGLARRASTVFLYDRRRRSPATRFSGRFLLPCRPLPVNLDNVPCGFLGRDSSSPCRAYPDERCRGKISTRGTP